MAKKSGAKGAIGKWMVVDDFGDSFDFVSGFRGWMKMSTKRSGNNQKGLEGIGYLS